MCILESMKAFYLYGFKTYALVRASNVSVIKATTGVQGAYGNNEVKPEFKNPLIQPGRCIGLFVPATRYTELL